MGWRWLGIGLLGMLAACGRGTAGPPQTIRTFGATDVPISTTGVTADDGGWRLQRADAGPVPLFEVPHVALEDVVVTYRARMRSQDVAGKAYLEMWVRVPGRGEFFSRGLAQPLHGTTGWASYEIPFLLSERGTRVDLVKLNVAFEGGGGTVWIRDVELLAAPL